MPLLLILGLAGFASAISFRSGDPMVPLIAADLGVSLNEAALLASAFALPYALMQLVLGPVGDAVGKTRVIRASLAIFSTGLVVSALAPSYTTLLVSRVLTGAFAGGIIPVCMALIGDRVPMAERQLTISRFLMAVILGQLAGAAGAGLLVDQVGWRAVFGLTAAISMAIALATNLVLDSRGEAVERPSLQGAIQGYRTVLRNPISRTVFAAVAGEGFLLFGVFPFLAPLLASHRSGGTFEAGLIIASFGVGGILYSLGVKPLLARLGTRRMTQIGAALGGLAYAGAAGPFGAGAVAALFLVAGFAFYMFHNTLQTHATELAPDYRGASLALFACLFFLGQGLGTVAVSEGSKLVGLEPMFVAFGLAIVILGLIASAALHRGSPLPLAAAG